MSGSPLVGFCSSTKTAVDSEISFIQGGSIHLYRRHGTHSLHSWVLVLDRKHEKQVSGCERTEMLGSMDGGFRHLRVTAIRQWTLWNLSIQNWKKILVITRKVFGSLCFLLIIWLYIPPPTPPSFQRRQSISIMIFLAPSQLYSSPSLTKGSLGKGYKEENDKRTISVKGKWMEPLESKTFIHRIWLTLSTFCWDLNVMTRVLKSVWGEQNSGLWISS